MSYKLEIYLNALIFALLYEPLRISTARNEKEDSFIHIYADNPLTSGKWEFVRNVALSENFDSGLKMIAHATHEKAFPHMAETFLVSSAIFGTAILVFDHWTPIHIDLVYYTVGDHEFYIAKGEQPFNTVYYLSKVDDEATTFRLDRHVADILAKVPMPMPTPIPMPLAQAPPEELCIAVENLTAEELGMELEDLTDTPTPSPQLSPAESDTEIDAAANIKAGQVFLGVRTWNPPESIKVVTEPGSEHRKVSKKVGEGARKDSVLQELGGQSTRPAGRHIGNEEEWNRLLSQLLATGDEMRQAARYAEALQAVPDETDDDFPDGTDEGEIDEQITSKEEGD